MFNTHWPESVISSSRRFDTVIALLQEIYLNVWPWIHIISLHYIYDTYVTQDEETSLQKLNLSDCKLKTDLNNVINALGSNQCLQVSHFLQLWFVNVTKNSKTIEYQRNLVSFSTFTIFLNSLFHEISASGMYLLVLQKGFFVTPQPVLFIGKTEKCV